VTNLPPIHREVFVDAFDVFTGQIGQWWPLAENGVYGGQSTVAFEEGRLIERSTDGEMSVWGTVTEWAPGQAVRFTWHPGKEAEKASAVSVSFNRRGQGTLVVLEPRLGDFRRPRNRPVGIRPRLAAGARAFHGLRRGQRRHGPGWR
jgi:hypothetical protein